MEAETADPQVITSYDDVSGIRGNVVHLDPGAGGEMVSSSIEFSGVGNVLVVENGTKLRNTRLRFLGNGSVIYLRRSDLYTRLVASVFDDSVVYLGPGCSFTSPARFIASERKHGRCHTVQATLLVSGGLAGGVLGGRACDAVVLGSGGDRHGFQGWVGA
jgi:hypothetical protein